MKIIAVIISVLRGVGLWLIPLASTAAIVINPAAPISTQSVIVRLTNQYASEASISAATITRSGNQFTINQTVNVACALPSAPVLTSDFDVGVLPPGVYQVVAQIVNVGFGPGCNPPTATQNATFSVVQAASVPTGSVWSYLVAAVLLVISGAWQVKRRHEA